MKSKIDDFKSACKFLKRDPKAIPDVSKLPEDEQKYLMNHFELMVMTDAFKQEQLGKKHRPDYTNSNEPKCYPYFGVKADKKNPSGSGFSRAHYGHWHSATSVGSRFCFPNRELTMHSATKWKKKHIINQLM